MAVFYHIRRKYHTKMGNGLVVDGNLSEAIDAAKNCVKLYGVPYTVFKCTQEELETYQPGEKSDAAEELL